MEVRLHCAGLAGGQGGRQPGHRGRARCGDVSHPGGGDRQRQRPLHRQQHAQHQPEGDQPNTAGGQHGAGFSAVRWVQQR